MNLLLITGGHGFEREPFLDIFRSLGTSFKEVQYPEAERCFTKEEVSHYAAFVFFDHNQTMSERSKRDLLARLHEGKGCLFLHHSIYNHTDWSEYVRILGGFWDFKEFEIDGKIYGPSTFSHGETIPVHIVDPNHPITCDMQDFTVVDEVYGNFYVAPDVTPLLTTDHPKSDRVIGWAKTYARSRIVYLQPGDAPAVYRDATYRKLIWQSLLWVTNHTVERDQR